MYVASGQPPPRVGQALAAARLIALAKENGDVRPIVVGKSLRRLLARSICVQERGIMAEVLSPVQYGGYFRRVRTSSPSSSSRS